MRGSVLMASLIAAMYASGGKAPGPRNRQEKPRRPCLNCGTPHDHNNAFCSASCCREYKRRDG